MFSQIKVALIKPGFGTIQDCVERGIPMISFKKKMNYEFSHNGKIINKYNLGIISYDFRKAFGNMLKLYNNKKKINIIYNNCKNLKWNGNEKIVESINKLR